jgi:signal peptidase I
MAPTLTDGQLVLTRSLRPADAVGRGDLVVLDSPVEPDQHVVKRVVGLPGVKVTFDAGRVSIDRRPLPEPYASLSVFCGEYDVPPGPFLVLEPPLHASSRHTRTAGAALKRLSGTATTTPNRGPV